MGARETTLWLSPSKLTLLGRHREMLTSMTGWCRSMTSTASGYAAVLRSAPADYWIIDASRNSVHGGIAFESYFGPGNTPSSCAVSCSARLGLTRTAVDGM